MCNLIEKYGDYFRGIFESLNIFLYISNDVTSFLFYVMKVIQGNYGEYCLKGWFVFSFEELGTI